MSNPLVKIQQGSLKGAIVDSEFGQFMTFSGVPYAAPPFGNLRFKDPQHPKSWEGVRDATKEGGVAPQCELKSNEFIGEDDCLYLNVSTNNLAGKKPVMVWIHGGGFKYGSGNADSYRPDYLMQHDIVFVSINYRLGIMGFLNLDREDCSGNQGLKDQVFALKWVQKNIEVFGGDKDNVTIFGESAGSVSVHYLCISPLAKGLFHKAIAQSGVAANSWALQASNKKFAMKIAAKLGCSSSNNDAILQFLRNIHAEKILITHKEVFDDHGFKLEFQFEPTMDNKCTNPFLPKPLSELIENGIDVPLIIGYTSHEGLIALACPTFINAEDIKKFKDEFEKFLAKDLNIDLSVAAKFSKDVKQFYFGENNITKLDEENYVQYKGDTLFVAGIWHVLENQLQKKTPTYLYKFSHRPELSAAEQMYYSHIKVKGSCHGDDLKILFPSQMQLRTGTKDYSIMESMSRMWTDFAKTGNPTPNLIKSKWLPYNSDKKCCQHIVDDFKTEDNFIEGSWKLWKPIFEKYNLF